MKKRISANNGANHCNGHVPAPNGTGLSHEVAFGYPRDFMRNQYVYLVISPRAHGLSIGLNLNPAAACNFSCLYCEVNRTARGHEAGFDLSRMVAELGETLELAQGGWLRQWPRYAKLPAELLQVRHVALSGDGEPTLSPYFAEVAEAVAGLRHTGRHFKIVLVTNSTALDQPLVQRGLAALSPTDEVWAKLDGGTQEYLNRVNGPTISLPKIMANILTVGASRPVVIQSLFPALNGDEPPAAEIKEYAQRLKELKDAGANIPL
ncbi:MAG TPA: radical SAM protein, partial [Verrucomicrobiae bacterium]